MCTTHEEKKITYAMRRFASVDVDGFEPPTLCL